MARKKYTGSALEPVRALAMSRPRVLIADDHALIVSAVENLLRDTYDVVGSAENGQQLIEEATRLKPDVVILDISMPLVNGLEAAKQIQQVHPDAQFVFLSMHKGALYLRRAMEAGARAYVLKTGLIEELLDALRKIAAGETYFSPGLSISANSSRPLLPASDPGRGDLTNRQLEIVRLIAEGKLSKEIAHQLNISIKTVEFHRARIMARFGVQSVAELVRGAIDEGLLEN